MDIRRFFYPSFFLLFLLFYGLLDSDIISFTFFIMVTAHAKRLISKGILGIIALGTVFTTTTLADDFMYVTAYHLNVRSSGTFRSSIIATVDNGYKVVVLEKLANGWSKVLLENGQVGYVNARYLGISEPYFEKALGSEYEVSVPSAFVRADGLQKKIAVLHRGDRLEVLDRKIFLQKWIRVRIVAAQKEGYIGRVGYISKKIVRVVDGMQYPEESSLLNSAPEEDTSLDAISTDWIGGSEDMNGMTFNSAPKEPSVVNGADMADFLKALKSIDNIDTPVNTGTVVESVDTGSLEDILGGLLDDTGSPAPSSNTGTTTNTNTGNTSTSDLDALFGSLLN